MMMFQHWYGLFRLTLNISMDGSWMRTSSCHKGVSSNVIFFIADDVTLARARLDSVERADDGVENVEVVVVAVEEGECGDDFLCLNGRSGDFVVVWVRFGEDTRFAGDWVLFAGDFCFDLGFRPWPLFAWCDGDGDAVVFIFGIVICLMLGFLWTWNYECVCWRLDSGGIYLVGELACL